MQIAPLATAPPRYLAPQPHAVERKASASDVAHHQRHDPGNLQAELQNS